MRDHRRVLVAQVEVVAAERLDADRARRDVLPRMRLVVVGFGIGKRQHHAERRREPRRPVAAVRLDRAVVAADHRQVERAHFRIGEQRGVLAGQPRDIAYQRIVGLQVQVRQALAMRRRQRGDGQVKRRRAARFESRRHLVRERRAEAVPEQHERRVGIALQRVGGGAGECVDRRQARLAEAFLAARILQREQVDVHGSARLQPRKKFAVPPACGKQTSCARGHGDRRSSRIQVESVGRALMRPPPATGGAAGRAAISCWSCRCRFPGSAA